MSIINEALKKAQSRLEKRKKPQEIYIKKTKETKSHWLFGAVILVSIGFIGCCITLYFIVFSKGNIETVYINTNEDSQKKASPLNASPKQIVSTETATPPSSEIATPPSSVREGSAGLILSGIITMDGDQFALINNEIYKKGDYIENKKVVNIFEDKVELLNEGKIITLKTK